LAGLAALLPVEFPLGLLIADGILTAVLVADWALAIPPDRIEVERVAPPTVALGQAADLRWVVTNRGSRRTKVHLSDELAPSLSAPGRRFELVVGAGAAVTLNTTLQPARRGDFVLEEMVVRTGGPLGMAGRQQTRRRSGRVRVVPSFRSRREVELRMNRARILEVGVRSSRFHGGGSDFDRLRDYTPDDESRRIDWAATARAGRPIVRAYRAERNQHVTLLLDTGRLMAARVAGVPRLEHAMDAAMSIASVAARLGDRVGLVAFDRRVRRVVPHAEARGQLRRIVDAVYLLEPELVESDYRGALLETAARFRRRSLLVIITDLAEQAIEENLFAALPAARNHLVAIGSVRDPQLDEWAEARPTAAETAYRQAAALDALERRARLAARLGGRGAAVIDDVPARFAAALTDFYLDVKAAGRL
jgi:uncharacterized protein (DUF58 family)